MGQDVALSCSSVAYTEAERERSVPSAKKHDFGMVSVYIYMYLYNAMPILPFHNPALRDLSRVLQRQSCARIISQELKVVAKEYKCSIWQLYLMYSMKLARV